MEAIRKNPEVICCIKNPTPKVLVMLELMK